MAVLGWMFMLLFSTRWKWMVKKGCYASRKQDKSTIIVVHHIKTN